MHMSKSRPYSKGGKYPKHNASMSTFYVLRCASNISRMLAGWSLLARKMENTKKARYVSLASSEVCMDKSRYDCWCRRNSKRGHSFEGSESTWKVSFLSAIVDENCESSLNRVGIEGIDH